MRSRVLAAWLVAAVVAIGGCSNSPSTASRSPSAKASASGGAGLPFPASSDAALDPAIAGTVRARVEAVVEENRRFPNSSTASPGLSVAIVSEAGTWRAAAGLDGGRHPVTPEAMFAIGSITKTFTAAEVLKLAAAGRVDLDAPMSRYVHHRLTANGATVRQALGMRSGLRDQDDRVIEAVLREPTRRWTPEQTLAVVAAPSASPGGSPVYANVNYVLLGMLIRNVTHRPVERVLRADLLGPAHLARVAVQPAEKPSPPLAAPVSDLRLGPSGGYLPTVSIAGFANTAGGMAADASSIARWGYLLYGQRVLPPSVSRALTDGAQRVDGGSFRYGLGTYTYRTGNGFEVVGHFGGIGGYSTALAVVPARHLSLAVLALRDDRNMELIVEHLLGAALP
jgi:CubicO group peptidase (beta-lactamase class C family)